MRKIEKAEHLEAARVLLVTAHDLIMTAERKIAEVHHKHLGFQHAEECVLYVAHYVIELQNKLRGIEEE